MSSNQPVDSRSTASQPATRLVVSLLGAFLASACSDNGGSINPYTLKLAIQGQGRLDVFAVDAQGKTGENLGCNPTGNCSVSNASVMIRETPATCWVFSEMTVTDENANVVASLGVNEGQDLDVMFTKTLQTLTVTATFVYGDLLPDCEDGGVLPDGGMPGDGGGDGGAPGDGGVCPGAGLDGGDFPTPCPITLAPAPGAFALGVGAADLYIAYTGTSAGVALLFKGGGALTPLSSFPVYSLVADNSGGFWLEDNGSLGRLTGAPTAGNPVVLFAPDSGYDYLNSDTGLALDSQYVYFPMIHYEIDAGSQYGFDEILRVPKFSGGPPELLIVRPFDASYGVSAMAVDDTSVYFAMKHTGYIFSSSKTGGGPLIQVGAGTDYVSSMAVDTTSLYFLASTHVHKVAKTGVGATTDVTPRDGGAQTINSFTIDATSIGFTDSLAGVVQGSDLQGNNPFPLAPPEEYPTALGWEPGHAYWISRPNGDSKAALIRRVAR